jgi:hypothetical protein
MSSGELVPDSGGPSDLDLIAASLRAETTDIRAFVEGLATKLEEAVPGLVRVERARAGFRGPKVVRSITVDAGGDRLELASDGGDRVQTTRARVSGGITLKSEAVGIDEWIATLSGALSEEASRSERTRQVLERLLLG